MVEPLKPEQIKAALKRGTKKELAEYERLLSEQFETDPSLEDEAAGKACAIREQRLKILSRQLFG